MRYFLFLFYCIIEEIGLDLFIYLVKLINVGWNFYLGCLVLEFIYLIVVLFCMVIRLSGEMLYFFRCCIYILVGVFWK